VYWYISWCCRNLSRTKLLYAYLIYLLKFLFNSINVIRHDAMLFVEFLFSFSSKWRIIYFEPSGSLFLQFTIFILSSNVNNLPSTCIIPFFGPVHCEYFVLNFNSCPLHVVTYLVEQSYKPQGKWTFAIHWQKFNIHMSHKHFFLLWLNCPTCFGLTYWTSSGILLWPMQRMFQLIY
jgi:hypothetical protein